jgi:multicomponent Na+:H+ antiporter subunit F
MNALPQLLALFLFANLLVTLWRALRGPTAADRLLAALLFGTTGVAILALLSVFAGNALLDAALVLALLAAITGAAFAQRAWRYPASESEHERR